MDLFRFGDCFAVSLIDSTGLYREIMTIMANIKNPSVNLNKLIRSGSDVYEIVDHLEKFYCKARFNMFNVVVSSDEELDFIKDFADKMNLDLLINPNPVRKFLINHFSVKNFKNINSQYEFLSALKNAVYGENNLTKLYKNSSMFNIMKESVINKIRFIVLDVDHSYDKFGHMINCYLVNQNVSYNMYKTSSGNMRIYINVHPINLNKYKLVDGVRVYYKQIVKNFYEYINDLFIRSFGIDVDMSFKRLAHQVWLEEFRSLAKNGDKSELVKSNVQCVLFSFDSVVRKFESNLNNIVEYKSKAKQESTNIINSIMYEDSAIFESYRKFKSVITNRIVNLLSKRGLSQRSALLTVVGNIKWLVINAKFSKSKINDVIMFAKNIVNIIISKNKIKAGSTFKPDLEYLFKEIEPLPFEIPKSLNKHIPYNEIMKTFIIIISSDKLRQESKIKKIDNCTYRFSTTAIESSFGIAHSSLFDIMNILVEGGFCEKIENSFKWGTTYKFIKPVMIETFIDDIVEMAMNGFDADILSEHFKDRESFSYRMISYLHARSNGVRFWKYVKYKINMVKEMFNGHEEIAKIISNYAGHPT